MSLIAAFKRLPPVQRGRIVLGIQLVVAALVFFAMPIFTWVNESDRVEVSASSYYDDEHAARFATDGVPATEWLLPDGTLGYLELTFHSKRVISGVSITNGHNLNFMDRAIKKARIYVYDGPKILEQHDIELPGIQPEHKARRIDLDKHRATRVRIEVLELEGNGAALAEFSVY